MPVDAHGSVRTRVMFVHSPSFNFNAQSDLWTSIRSRHAVLSQHTAGTSSNLAVQTTAGQNEVDDNLYLIQARH